MNTKKHKNKPKQNKPHPQPKSDNETEIQEKDALINEDKEESQDKVEIIKSEEPIPNVSETVTPVLEAKVSEGDTPKKPKRNRGKKKKTDKDEDFDDNFEDKPSELATDENKAPLETQEVKTTDIAEEKPSDVTEVTPAARKKKNKNKKQTEQAEKADEIKISPITKEELADVKIITCVPVASETDESKSKKKNKKKKTTDSEKSDKAEEAISCTEAFQKLLQSGDKEHVQKDTQVEPITTDVKEEIAIEPAIIESDLTKHEEETKDDHKEEGAKGKKKNKKDKNHPAKIEDAISKPIETIAEATVDEKLPVAPMKIFTEPMPQEVVVTKYIEKLETLEGKAVEKEKSLKPKAKIAKPVEKKRKGKADESSTENLSEKDAEKPKEDIPTHTTDTPKTVETKAIDETVTKLVETGMLDTKPVETKVEVKEEIQVSQTPEIKQKQIPEHGTGKKGKKGKQKLSETVEVKEATVDVGNVPKSDKIETKKEESFDIRPITPVTKSKKAITTKTDITAIQPPTELEQGTKKPDIAIPLGYEPLSSTDTKKLTTPEIDKTPENILLNVLKSIDTETSKAELQLPETSSSKKRKKSPKRPKTAEKTTEKIPEKAPLPIPENINKGTEQTDIATEAQTESLKGISEEMKESITELPPLEDIEIRSVKTEESEGSACDIIPDVHYPRASSQLLDDNNNTTVIQEVTAADVKINIPIVMPDAPIIQGSGETPMPCPELVSCGITFTEIESTTCPIETTATKPKEESPKDMATSTEYIKPKFEEKTDLKSKVLDVNQGMEELRKSIERSLAELSAIEKNEKEAEEQFAKAQNKLEEIKELASKRSEEKKELAKPEKVIPMQVLAEKKVPKTEDIQKQLEKAQEKFEEIKDLASKSEEKKEISKTEKSAPIQAENIISKAEEIQKQEENKNVETSIKQKTRQQETKIEIPKPIDMKVEEKPEPEIIPPQIIPPIPPPPPLPARKDNKGKGKKKKGKQETEQSTVASASTATTTGTSSTSETKESQESKKEEKTEQKTEKTDNNQDKGKQQSDAIDANSNDNPNTMTDSLSIDFEPIENFEDAMTSSADDVNKTFEIIAEDARQIDPSQNPQINITAPIEDDEKEDTKNPKHEKVNPVSQPKNLLGHPDIPARLNKTDYKKEKDKTPNLRQAKVKIKDSVPIEVTKQSKESQTENKRRFLRDKTVAETISSVTNDNEEYIYKYSFRKVFLPSACHVCKKDLKPVRVPCTFCNLVFYCSPKHKDEDYSQHQALCFAVSTIGHLKEQKHIYGDAKNITGQDYRLLRMQMIVSCEKVLKRRLVPWEQEALLYPRLCADVTCREWRQNKLVDCEGCGQIAYCADTDHLPKTHQRWCKSYSLYHRLVVYQQTKGRLEPKLPTRVMAELYQIPEKLNEVLASMFEEKIDMTDIQYATLTQIATAPLTAAFCQQLFTSKMNGIYANGTHKKSSFTIHVVGAELQFEADALNKWEVFFLHLRPDVKDLRVVLVGPDLNPSKLPLDLLGKIKLCENCRLNKRRVVFEFQDNKTYNEYWSTDFSTPDLVCAFNPSIQRSSAFNGKDTWPSAINCIMKLRVPFIITSYTMSELIRDLTRIKDCSENAVGIISEPKYNAFASVRPDRNFITDDEMPLLFKNFCFTVVCGSI